MDFRIRPEAPGDAPAIAAVTIAAFAFAEQSDGNEHRIVDALRGAGVLAVSLVAEDAGGLVIGHVAASPVTISDGTPGWHGLAPLSVLPVHQRRGAGRALVRAALAGLRRMGAAGCVLLGDPRYYARFGFRHEPALAYPGVPAGYFQALAFDSVVPSGTVVYHEAFGTA